MGRTGALAKTACVTLTACGVVAVAPVASADSPPPSWSNLRTLSCDGTTVQAAFAPGGVFTSFHILGSSDVIVPKHVEVVFPGTSEPVTTLHVPGFDHNDREVVSCQYVDPAGLAVTIVGVRT